MATRTFVNYTTALVLETCCECGVPFGMSETLYQQRLRDRQSFSCPNGHEQHYSGKPTEQQLREQLERAQGRNRHLEDQRDAAQRSARAYKGVATRTKRRAAAGVCPVDGCRRTFQNVARHVAGQHPDYQPEHA